MIKTNQPPRNPGRFTEVLAPIVDEPIGGKHEGGVAFVALMHDGFAKALRRVRILR